VELIRIALAPAINALFSRDMVKVVPTKASRSLIQYTSEKIITKRMMDFSLISAA
jgi:hypothetical protein